MAEPLKNYYNQAFMYSFFPFIQRYVPNLSLEKFLALVFSDGWENLALKERVGRLTRVLHLVLPNDYESALNIVVSISKDIQQETHSSQGFFHIFLPTYVEKYGLQEFDKSMKALEEITKLCSAEFAVRPFLIQQPLKGIKILEKWAFSKDERVRRLASEGSRPSLPWATKLKEFEKNPSWVLPILELLKEDPSLYVRKSVANHLNDISKVHPDWVLELAADWVGQHPHTDWILKSALRTLIKKGNPEAMGLFALRPVHGLKVTQFELGKTTVQKGGVLPFSVDVELNSTQNQKIRWAYHVYYAKKSGEWSPKVFFLNEGSFSTGKYSFSKKISFKDLTTRKHYTGKHKIVIVANGQAIGEKVFEVVD